MKTATTFGLIFMLILIPAWSVSGQINSAPETTSDPASSDVWEEEFKKAHLLRSDYIYEEAGLLFSELGRIVCNDINLKLRCLETQFFSRANYASITKDNLDEFDQFYQSWKRDVREYEASARPGEAKTLQLHAMLFDIEIRQKLNLDSNHDQVLASLDSLKATPEAPEFQATGHSALLGLTLLSEVLIEVGAFEEITPLLNELDEESIQEGYLKTIFLSALRQNVANSMRRTGQVDKAIEIYTKALTDLRKSVSEGHYLILTAVTNIGTGYYISGQYTRAADYFKIALKIAQNHPEDLRRSEALLYRNLGTTYYMMEDVGLAGEYLEQGQRILDDLGEGPTITVATTYSIAAELYRVDGNFEAAERAYLESLSVRRAVNGQDHPDAIPVLVNTGNLYAALGKNEEADAMLTEARRLAELNYHPSRPIFLEIDIQLSKNEQAKGDLLKSWNIMQASLQKLGLPLTEDILEGPNRLQKFDRVTDPVITLNALLMAAEIKKNSFDETGDPGEAKKGILMMDTAIALIEYLHQDQNDEQSASDRHHNYYKVYTMKLDLLYRLLEQGDSPAVYSMIFETMEYARSRLASILLNELESETSSILTPELFDERRSLYIERINLRKNMLTESGGLRAAAVIDSVRQEVVILNEKIVRLENKIADLYPDYHAQLYDFTVPPLSDVQQSLRDQEAMVLYMSSMESMYAMVITRDDVQVRKMSDVEPAFIAAGETKELLERLAELNDTESMALRSLLVQLHGILVEPLEDLITDKELMISPDQTFHYLPFDLLLTEKVDHLRFDEWPFLIRRQSISMVQSVKFWLNRAGNRREPSRELLAMAPFTEFQEAGVGSGMLSSAATEAAVVESSTAETPTSDAYASKNPDGVTFAPLIMSAVETSRIRDIVASNQENENFVTLLQGPMATQTAFRKADPGVYRIIHLSTHASVVETDHTLSHLVLHPDDPEQLIYAGDVYSLDLAADLIVLSACETGLGEYSRGDGLVGFTRAFFYAGARNVISSMWKVNDRSTALFMIDFYEKLSEGYSYRESIRLAKLFLIQHPQFNAPYYWAAFQLHEGFR